jgi:hypothetical protein
MVYSCSLSKINSSQTRKEYKPKLIKQEAKIYIIMLPKNNRIIAEVLDSRQSMVT